MDFKATSPTAMHPRVGVVIQFDLPSGLPLKVGDFVELSCERARAVAQVHAYIGGIVTALVKKAHGDGIENFWIVRWAPNWDEASGTIGARERQSDTEDQD